MAEDQNPFNNHCKINLFHSLQQMAFLLKKKTKDVIKLTPGQLQVKKLADRYSVSAKFKLQGVPLCELSEHWLIYSQWSFYNREL